MTPLPYRIDFFSVFIFLGIAQALLLAFFYLSKNNRKNPFNFFQGLFLLVLAAVILEIFLMYSGYIQHVLHLVDFSESLALLLGPLFYFALKSLINDKKPKRVAIHLLPFVVHSLYLLFFLLQSEEVKYNAWIGAYYPGMERLPVDLAFSDDPLRLRRFISTFTFYHITFYGALCAWMVFNVFKSKKESFLKPDHPVLVSLRNGILILISISIVIFIAEFFFVYSTGEHLIASYASLSVYFLSFSVIRNSIAFKQTGLNGSGKYRSSSLTKETIETLTANIKQVMENGQPYLNDGYSLQQLADSLRVTVHTASQAINEGLGKNFYELLAEYRIAHAQKLLKDPNLAHLKIEEIAWQSGYNSKSSFNTAFKKITGLTPSQYRSDDV